jgi:hypothetical protein
MLCVFVFVSSHLSGRGQGEGGREALIVVVFVFVFVFFASPLAGEGRVRGLAKGIIQKRLNDYIYALRLRFAICAFCKTPHLSLRDILSRKGRGKNDRFAIDDCSD